MDDNDGEKLKKNREEEKLEDREKRKQPGTIAWWLTSSPCTPGNQFGRQF